jgi:hypothetical protein
MQDEQPWAGRNLDLHQRTAKGSRETMSKCICALRGLRDEELSSG